MYRIFIVATAWIAAMVVVIPASAEWPQSIELGGFTVSEIVGNDDSDDSGRATGKLLLPGADGFRISLVRSAAGMVTGSTRTSFSAGSVRIDGSFLLDRRGLQGTGIVHTSGRPVTDANLAVSPGGSVTGRGRVYLGQGKGVDVTCDVTKRGADVRGTAPAQSSIDTPLAVYTFKGDIKLSSVGTALVATATGSIERKGKIGGMASTYGPLSFDVDLATGQSVVNVGGASITVDLW